jgi:hypothetical protein
VSQRKERKKERKKERNPSICNALSHRHYQNQGPLGFAPNMNPNYSDANAHRPTLLLLPLLGLYSTTLGTQTKCTKQGLINNTCGGGSLSLSLFSKENNWRVYGSGILTLDPRFSKLRECVSDPEPTVLKNSQTCSTNVP